MTEKTINFRMCRAKTKKIQINYGRALKKCSCYLAEFSIIFKKIAMIFFPHNKIAIVNYLSQSGKLQFYTMHSDIATPVGVGLWRF